MSDFLRDYYSEITILVEFLAAFTGIFFLPKYSESVVRIFIYFLVYVFFLEFLSYLVYISDFKSMNKVRNLIDGTIFKRNYWWLTIGWYVIATIILVYFYFKVLRDKSYKILIKILGLLFICFSLIYLFLNIDKLWNQFFPLLNNLSSFVILSSIVLFFFELLKTDRILDIKRSFYFFVSAALFIYLLVITPLSFYNIYFRNVDWNYIFLQMDIYLIMNTFLYLTFAFALIWCKPEQDL